MTGWVKTHKKQIFLLFSLPCPLVGTVLAPQREGSNVLIHTHKKKVAGRKHGKTGRREVKPHLFWALTLQTLTFA